MKQLRGSLAALCGLLCVAALIVGSLEWFAARTIFNPSVFSKRVAESLEQPEVARVISGVIVDQIVAAHRDLTPYRPVLLGTVEYVVSSAPFRAVVRRAAKETHETLISQTGKDITLSVPDLGVILKNALASQPQIAEKLPAKLGVVLDLMERSPASDRVVAVLQARQRLRLSAFAWLGGGLVLGACGILLSRRKDRFLLRVGFGLTVISLVIAAAARFGGYAVASFARTPVGADLVRGLWPAFVGPLAIRALILSGIGLVLVAAVTSLLEKVDLGVAGRSFWARLAARKPRPGWGIARGAFLIAIGIAIAFNAETTLVVIAGIVGAVLFFLGVQELFTTAVGFIPKMEHAIAILEKKERASIRPAVVVGVLALVLAGAGALWLTRETDDTAAVTAAIDACNGSPELCGRRFNQVALATTHNSMAAADIADWMFPNQERGIQSQLEDGIRGFLIDIHYGVPVGDKVKTLLENEENAVKKYEAAFGKEGVEAAMRIRERLIGAEEGKRDVYLCHGFCELGDTPFVAALEAMREFLVANPNEIVIVVLQDEGVAPADVAECFERSRLIDFVYRGAVTPPWPTLREMIERDERVVVFAENDAEGVPWYHPVSGNIQETPYGFKDPSEFSNKPNRGGTNGSLLLMNHWIETTPAPLPSNAEIVNARDFLLKRARACRKERGMIPNLIAVDFYRTGDVVGVARAMNGVKTPTDAPAP